MNNFSLAIAFVGGLVSFLSPCVLPIIPGFLTYLAGASLAESDARTKRKDIFLAALFFVLGFSAVFSALGILLNGVLHAAAAGVRLWLARTGGIVIILFGLYLTGLLRIPFLEQPHTLRVTRKFSSRHLTSFVFGAAFAAGWTPCVGAVLGGIFGLVAMAPGSAFALLFSYSLGLGAPFLLVGLFASRSSEFIHRFARLFRWVNILFGAALVLLGILAFTENLGLVANFETLNRFLLK